MVSENDSIIFDFPKIKDDVLKWLDLAITTLQCTVTEEERNHKMFTFQRL